MRPPAPGGRAHGSFGWRHRAAGFGGRAGVGHAHALGAVCDAGFGPIEGALARAGVAIMTDAPGTGPTPPVLRLGEAGAVVAAENGVPIAGPGA